jgi:hypothetical protein
MLSEDEIKHMLLSRAPASQVAKERRLRAGAVDKVRALTADKHVLVAREIWCQPTTVVQKERMADVRIRPS